MRIIDDQIHEQVLKDGGHFELSPMYHALIIEDILDLINICQANLPRLSKENLQLLALWQKLVPKMLFWLNSVSHPDGRISFFNDAAFGIAPENKELFAYAERLGIKLYSPNEKIIDLKYSGLLRLQNQNVVLIADLARIGPDYLPGHAHADTLSFELSQKERVFVNSGTSEYGLGAERLRQEGLQLTTQFVLIIPTHQRFGLALGLGTAL